MIYTNMKWMAFTLHLEKLTEYDKWFDTEEGQMPGFEGNVDINVYFDAQDNKISR